MTDKTVQKIAKTFFEVFGRDAIEIDHFRGWKCTDEEYEILKVLSSTDCDITYRFKGIDRQIKVSEYLALSRIVIGDESIVLTDPIQLYFLRDLVSWLAADPRLIPEKEWEKHKQALSEELEDQA